MIRQRVKIVPEKELGCGVNCETSGQVLKVNWLVVLQVRDVVESLGNVFVEEFEVGCPVVGKEWARSRAMLQRSYEVRGTAEGLLRTAFHISPSRFKIPDPRKVSLVSFCKLS